MRLRVLLTGATGFIGTAVTAGLRKMAVPIVTAGRRPVPGVAFIPTDLLRETDLDGLVRRAEATHLIHLAWEAGHGAYWAHPDNLQWSIVTARLVEAFCKADGQGIVVAGSCAEYDWSQGWCVEDETLSLPATVYGSAKEAARRLSSEFARFAGVPLAWARLFLSHGVGEDPRRLVPSILAALRGTRPAFPIDTEALRDILHVEDTAAALVRLLTGSVAGIANVSSGQPVPLREVVTTLAGILNADPAPLLALSAQRVGEPRLLAGVPKLLAATGWAPRLSLQQGLERHAMGQG